MPTSDSAKSVNRYITSVSVVGVGVAVAVAVLWPTAPFDVAPTSALVAAMVVSIWVPLRFVRRGGVFAIHVNDAILIALLFLVPAGLPPLIAVGASVLGNLLRTRELRKIAFNAGAHGLAATAATGAFHTVFDGSAVLEPSSIAAAVIAFAAYAGIDALTFGRLFGLLEERPLAASLRDVAVNLATFGTVNALLGLLLAFVVTVDRVATLFAFVLVVIAHVGYRGYAMALEERGRNRRLQEVTRELAGALGSPEGTERYVRALARLFEARAVKTVLSDGDRARTTILHDGSFETFGERLRSDRVSSEAMRRGAPVSASTADTGPMAERLAKEGYGSAMSVPVIHDGRVLGAITIFDPGGLESSGSDIDLLKSLANDAAIAARNHELFETVELERARLADETQKLQDIIGAATDGIVLVDADGRVRTWNPAMAALIGLPEQDAVGQPWYMALRLRDVAGNEVPIVGEGPVQRALGGYPNGVFNAQLLRTDGEWRWIRLTVSGVRHGADVSGAVLVVHDMHRERETDELKSDFIATVSHELRTPLTPLKGFLLTIINSEKELSSEQLSLFHTSMLRQVERLENLVGDLLVVADLDRGAVQPRLEPCDLSTLIADAVASELPLDAPDRIVLRPTGAVPAVADRQATVRVIRALVNNAVKHTQGAVTVRTSIDGDRACVSVTDEGPGIPVRDQARIFERFSRLGNHLTRSTQGTGLGLSIARSLAERTGGDLRLDSAPGQGATFVLTLPIARPAAIEWVGASPRAATGGSPASIEPA